MDLFDLTGKVAIVTGASRGIGLAIAETLAAAGAKVVLSSRKQAALDEVVQAFWERGQGALAVAAHTGEETAVAQLVARTIETYGGVDILVNNAATNPHFGHIMTAQEGHWDKILDVNVKGYFRMAKAVWPYLKARGGGKIVNVASVAGRKPQPMMGVYSVSKAAVLMLTEVLAAELAQDNIQVNAIAPGFVKTKFSAALWQNPAINQAVLKTIPQGRMAEVGEIAGMALYLASDAASFTTGATFLVDGGQMVGSGVSF